LNFCPDHLKRGWLREIQAFLAESHGTDVSPDFISSVTDEVMAETQAWQSRPLEPMYPVVFFDALRVKIRGDGMVSNEAVYLALGIQADARRDVLGLWIEQTEGAKFWLKVFNELRTRGCQDILIAVVNGLKGLAEAIGTVYLKTAVQTCMVHLIRNSLGNRSRRSSCFHLTFVEWFTRQTPLKVLIRVDALRQSIPAVDHRR
jgi:putative transposase